MKVIKFVFESFWQAELKKKSACVSLIDETLHQCNQNRTEIILIIFKKPGKKSH